MQHKMRDVLFNLLPPGDAISTDDTQLMDLLDSIGAEFDLIHEAMLEVVSAIPSNEGNILSSHWEKITKSTTPARLLAAKGYFTQDRYVSNTREHFASLCGPMVEIRAAPNRLEFNGIKNEITVLRAGSRSGIPLSRAERDEALITMIEKVKHAHTIATYKESKRA
jgi:hypothetical protein